MQNENRLMEKKICNACGTETDALDNKTGCQVCDDMYFGKIKESYSQNLKRLNIISKDLFNLFFDLSDESAQYSHKIITQYLEMERNLRLYNPPLYYSLTSYQFFRNRFLGNAMQSADMLYSNFMNIWKTNHSIMSKNVIFMLENMNKFYNATDNEIGMKKKKRLSEGDRNMIETIDNVNRMYDAYQKEEKTINVMDFGNTEKALRKQ